MKDLIEKLEAADCGSDELNYLIDQAFSNYRNLGGGWERHKVTGEERRNINRITPALTTSLDAALALAERVLPGVMWWISHQAIINGQQFYHAEVSVETEIEGQSGFARTPALALCAAILRARLDAEGKEPQ